MSKGNGTRSGLLWEVERLLTEVDELPQILLMENVPQVVADKNIQDFALWIKFLDSFGYQSKYKILNAKDYGIPQNRDRCFMLSWRGDYFYDFPPPIPLKTQLKDVLEQNVDEKYYLTKQQVAAREISSFTQYATITDVSNDKQGGVVMPTLLARDCKGPKCVKVAEPRTKDG